MPKEAKLQVLASGSSGNALFLGIGQTRLLIDAGIPLRVLARALAAIGEDLSSLTAVLVTHEHADHIRSLGRLRARQPQLAVYATAGTARALVRRYGPSIAEGILADGRTLQVGDVRVAPFAVSHDAAEPIGLRLDSGDFSLAVATDLGHASMRVQSMLAGCRVLVLEANHDLDLLRRGPYPEFLKRRIASELGHLSNDQAATLLRAMRTGALEQVILAHLSRHNNTIELAEAAIVSALAGSPQVDICSARRDRPTALYSFSIGAAAMAPLPPPVA